MMHQHWINGEDTDDLNGIIQLEVLGSLVQLDQARRACLPRKGEVEVVSGRGGGGLGGKEGFRYRLVLSLLSWLQFT